VAATAPLVAVLIRAKTDCSVSLVAMVVCGSQARVFFNTLNVVDSGHVVAEDRFLNRELRAIQFRKTLERMDAEDAAAKKR
jgi:hypothetical protein